MPLINASSSADGPAIDIRPMPDGVAVPERRAGPFWSGTFARSRSPGQVDESAPTRAIGQ